MKKKWLAGTIVVVLIVTVIVSAAFSDNPLSPKTTAEQKKMQDSQSQVLPDIFRNIASKFEGIDIPVYVPAYLPGNGPYGIANFRSTKKNYSFDVIKIDNPNSSETDRPISMADNVVFISASENPFSPDPTEEQLLAKPSGTVQIDGVTANSYENGMGVACSKGNWEFFAIGHAEQDGIRVAREIIRALPDDKDLVPGAVQGKLRVSQLGNPMYVTASWTYDGKTWYTLDGRSSPGERIKMLQSVTRLTEQKPARAEYYPQVPEKITTPKMALQAYFDALYFANNLTLSQMAAAGGTIGMGEEPYQAAYSNWSKEWQTKNSYEQFIASWAGTANVELLKLLPAGEEKGEKRFFVETKHLEVVGEKPHTGIFYYTGFFTVRETTEGWRITSGELEPENLGWQLGGHQPWRADAEQVARVSGIGVSIDTPLGDTLTIENPDGTVTVRFVDAQGKEIHEVTLYKPEDGIWRVLDNSLEERKRMDLYLTVMKAAFREENGGNDFIAVKLETLEGLSDKAKQELLENLKDLSNNIYDFEEIKADNTKFEHDDNGRMRRTLNGTLLYVSVDKYEGNEAIISATSWFGNLGAVIPKYKAIYENGKWTLQLIRMAVS